MRESIRNGLCCLINEIDNGNSEVDDESERHIMKYIRCFLRSDMPMSKQYACMELNISRATFDRLVREGRIPSGRKLIGFKEKIWYKRDLLQVINNTDDGRKDNTREKARKGHDRQTERKR